MDSNPPTAGFQVQAQQYGYPFFPPGAFANRNESNDYLSSLDSDTRDYVLKHTDNFRTMQDIINCVNELHGKS